MEVYRIKYFMWNIQIWIGSQKKEECLWNFCAQARDDRGAEITKNK